MNKIKYLLTLLLFTLFMPKVYAFTYDLETQVKDGTDNSLYEIRVSLKDIQGTSYGITACSLDVQLEGNIKLNSNIRTLGSWTVTSGDGYLFDTGGGILKDSEMFIIPVKVTGTGKVNLVNIECADYNELVTLSNKSISLVKRNDISNNSGSIDDNNENEEVEDSNCDLSDIILSDGEIQFDPGVTEYYIEINDFDSLAVEPVLASNKADFMITKGEQKVIINVTAQDGTEKVYTIYLEEISDEVLDENEYKKGDNQYIPIFVGIICVLVLINIFKIIRNKKK